MTEADISWVPFLMHKEYVERGREVPFLEDKPSTYLNKMYIVTQHVVEDASDFPEGAFLVRAEDPDDWLARFEKSPDFPAREWAENMARVYNRRLAGRRGQ